MRLLLDTCTFLWMIGQEERLSAKARNALEDGDNILTFHQVSAWEIQMKHQTGKLKLAQSPEITIQEAFKCYDLHYAPRLK